MTRYNLISPRPGKDDKTFWHKVGSAFARDKGGFSLVFDSLPLPDKDGRVTLLMTEPLPDDGGQRSPSRQEPDRRAPAGGRSDYDDEIPFNLEWR
jgi:hypothetical protein